MNKIISKMLNSIESEILIERRLKKLKQLLPSFTDESISSVYHNLNRFSKCEITLEELSNGLKDIGVEETNEKEFFILTSNYFNDTDIVSESFRNAGFIDTVYPEQSGSFLVKEMNPIDIENIEDFVPHINFDNSVIVCLLNNGDLQIIGNDSLDYNQISPSENSELWTKLATNTGVLFPD